MTRLWAYELPVPLALDRVAYIGFGVCGSNGQLSYNDRNRGEIVQFARFGFCRLEKKEEKMQFIYCHE